MKILLTGSAGFIGFHLSKSLLDDGHSILGIDNINPYYDKKLKYDRLDILNGYDKFEFKKIDISNKNLLSEAFLKFNPRKVVNLAAQAGSDSIENPYEYMNANLVGFLNIIELCRHSRTEGLIYASSSSVYGSNSKIPFSLDDRTDNPISLYAASKKSNELIANAYSHLYNLNTTGLRFFTVYGPWGRPDMAMFIFINKILSKELIPVFNNGNMKRDFTYIDDIISGTKSAINKNYKCEIFNLGNNKSENLMDVISYIELYLNKKGKIDYQPMQPGDVQESFASINKSVKMLDYKPSVNIDVGIKKLIKWYKNYYQYDE